MGSSLATQSISMSCANTGSGSSEVEGRGCDGKWRQCAGAIIFNRRREVLIGRRKDNCNNWQFPQGGIEDGGKLRSGLCVQSLGSSIQFDILS